MTEGVCKLTGEFGKFLDCHLLPKALTKADGLGVPFTEAGRGRRPRKRHSSWYDNRLVTMAGETILATSDDWAIRELRRLKLVWSGWGPMVQLADLSKIPGTDFGIRELYDCNWHRLRLFFLSLLWRAAASEREEFDEIVLDEHELEFLRKMVAQSEPEPLEFFPISLIQLSSIGLKHNHTPLAQNMTIPSLVNGEPEWEAPIFRFYLDGLVIHFSRLSIEDNRKRDLGDLIVAGGKRLVVTTVPFERSAQFNNIQAIMSEASNFTGRK